jgi:hypothetical protein
MGRVKRAAAGSVVAGLFLQIASATLAVDYAVERIASGLNQPTYVAQAPDDPSTVLYYSQRTTNTIQGFSVVNSMGGVYRYDTTTRTSTEVLDLSSRKVFNDDGLQTFAFNPDFNTKGSNGYGKIYVSSAEYTGSQAVGSGGNSNTLPTDRVEEFTVLNPDGTFKSLSDAFGTRRMILQYVNNAQNNHTIDWIGFNPTSTGAARNYLYISTGDSSFGNSYNQGASFTNQTATPSVITGRPSQNPSEVKGKILRVDISGTSAPPSDPRDAATLKSYSIPPSNPFPTYNLSNPAKTGVLADQTNHANTVSSASALGEVYVTGVRNAYRVSFDRATGDMFWGDVGENAVEEVDFLKAGSNAAGPPVDYGWPVHEGTDPVANQLRANTPGVPNPTVPNAPTHSTTTNPFTGVTSLKPVQQFPHVNGAGGSAVIGGYVYRGPIASLQGKYFYADFVETNDVYGSFSPAIPQLYQLSFDRNTDPSTFNGANGTVTDISQLWNGIGADAPVVFDPTDPSYTTSKVVTLPSGATSAVGGLDHIVSFGEDNLGNLYLVDFGSKASTQSTFDGEYPAAATGEIFMLVPVPEPASCTLMLLAGGGLWYWRRRSKVA